MSSPWFDDEGRQLRIERGAGRAREVRFERSLVAVSLVHEEPFWFADELAGVEDEVPGILSYMRCVVVKERRDAGGVPGLAVNVECRMTESFMFDQLLSSN